MSSQDSTPLEENISPRVRVSIVVTVLGFLLFVIGAKPDWFGWDRSPVVGFVQIAIFLAGMAVICLGGYLGVASLWLGRERTIMADIGSRLVGTGYVVAVFAGLADIFGMGSQAYPMAPYFGPWQATGVLIGQGIIAIGFLLLIPYQFRRSK